MITGVHVHSNNNKRKVRLSLNLYKENLICFASNQVCGILNCFLFLRFGVSFLKTLQCNTIKVGGF